MKHFFLGLSALVIVILVITAVGWVLAPVQKVVERKVLVNSHQYVEGMQARGAILQANIIEVEAMLSVESDPEVRNNLQAQVRGLRAQLNAISIQRNDQSTEVLIK